MNAYKLSDLLKARREEAGFFYQLALHNKPGRTEMQKIMAGRLEELDRGITRELDRESKKKGKKKGGTPEQKLAQDVAKAQKSIELLGRIQHDPKWDCSTPEAFYEAMQSEARRLRKAIQNPRKLWAIYRRADKGTPYYTQELAKAA